MSTRNQRVVHPGFVRHANPVVLYKPPTVYENIEITTRSYLHEPGGLSFLTSTGVQDSNKGS